MILDFCNRREGYLHDLTIRAFDLYAGSGEGLGGFHAANNTAHASAVDSDNLDIILTVERLQSGERLCYLHRQILPEVRTAVNYRSNMPLSCREVYRNATETAIMQPENIIWRIESGRVFFRLMLNQVSLL